MVILELSWVMGDDQESSYIQPLSTQVSSVACYRAVSVSNVYLRCYVHVYTCRI